MNEYVAMLRGINVTGKNIIPMKDLKKMFEELGLCDAETYIQSGNVTFQSSEHDTEKISLMLEKEVAVRFGISSPVIIRTKPELSKMIRNRPFRDEENSKIYFTLFRSQPDEENVKALSKFKSEHESIKIKDDHACIFLREGYGKAKLTNNFIESKLGISATTRNLRTIRHLAGLSRD